MQQGTRDLGSSFLVQVGNLPCHCITLAQNGDIAELQCADEVVHRLAGERLGAERTIGVDFFFRNDCMGSRDSAGNDRKFKSGKRERKFKSVQTSMQSLSTYYRSRMRHCVSGRRSASWSTLSVRVGLVGMHSCGSERVERPWASGSGVTISTRFTTPW